MLNVLKFHRRLHLDFETFSELDIRRTGAHKYAMHESTEVLMLYWAINDGEIHGWIPEVSPVMPPQLVEALRDPNCAKMAFNAAFERLILKHVLNLDIPADQWRCTMVASYYLGFTGGLGMVLRQTGLSVQKDPKGQQLINMFSKPAPKNHHAERYTSQNRPNEWEEFKNYCHNDVFVERQLFHFLCKYPTMREWDWDRYALDQKINDRGVFTDVAMAEGAQKIWDDERATLTEELRELSGLPKVTPRPFLAHLNEMGLDAQTLQKAELEALATSPHIGDDLRQQIRLWIEKEAKAVSKYTAVIRGACDDSRARGMFQFKGASRTDRTAGRRLQLQNLKRSVLPPEQIKAIVEAIRSGNGRLLNMMTSQSLSETLGTSIRHAIQAPPGRTLVVYDLASIESVVLGWLVECSTIMNTFREGRDTYKVFAAEYFQQNYDDITRDQRNFSKPPVLGCGYMLGWKGMIAYAEGYGVSMSEDEAKKAVSTFRGMYPEIVEFWRWIYDTIIHVIRTGNSCTGYRLTVERCEDFLRIWLPSGRALSYYQPEVSARIAPWTVLPPMQDGSEISLNELRQRTGMTDEELVQAGWANSGDLIQNVSYMGTDAAYGGRWTRTFSHAGLFTENIIQSIAYDLLFDALTRADAKGLEIVLQVHDEIGVEVDDGYVEWAEQTLQQCMTELPPWGQDLWLGADGYSCKFYHSG